MANPMSEHPLEWHMHLVDFLQYDLEQYELANPYVGQRHKDRISEAITELDDYWSLGGVADG